MKVLADSHLCTASSTCCAPRRAIGLAGACGRLRFPAGKVRGVPAMALAAILVMCSHGQATPPSHVAAGSKPNVVIVLADDLGWWSTGTYGDPNLKTPNLDKLAAQGMKFDYAFANCPVCTPCRCALGTGVYAIRSHIWSNNTLPKDDAPGLKSIAEHLTALGYRIGLYGKTDIGPFEQTAKTKYAVNPEKFIKAKSDQPLFLVYGSTYPHVPWTMRPQLSPEKIIMPPMLVDNAETRQALCAYYAAAGHFDEEVGQCMRWVQEAGLEDNTVFIVTGEQGTPFPRGKWTCCDDGLRTVFVIRWPGKIKAHSTTKALIQYIDVAPTLVEIAGGDPAACDTGLPGAVGGGGGFDGRSFLDVLLGKKAKHDAYVYGTFNNVSAIRSVRDSHFLYIANVRQTPFELIPWAGNATPAGLWKGSGDGTGTRSGLWKSWQRDAASNRLAATVLTMCKNPPPEELYDVVKDPHQLNNLVNDPQYHEQLELLKKQLAAWRKQYGDEKISKALTPLVELDSDHGSSETPEGVKPLLIAGSWMGPGGADGCVQAGLARGRRVRIIASTDSHSDHPGAQQKELPQIYEENVELRPGKGRAAIDLRGPMWTNRKKGLDLCRVRAHESTIQNCR